MQARVARRLSRVVTVSDSARGDIIREFKVDPGKVGVVHNDVDADLFRPLPDVRRVPGRVLTFASADAPIKGLAFLIEAIAKLKTERDVELVVVGKGGVARGPRDLARRFGIVDAIRFEGAVDSLRLVELYAEAELAVVPSLYEGFSLPAIEAMFCGVPLVTTTPFYREPRPEIDGRLAAITADLNPVSAGGSQSGVSQGKALDFRHEAPRLSSEIEEVSVHGQSLAREHPRFAVGGR